jgi:hypothetical protein
MSVVLLRNKRAAEYPLLPQSVYDDYADTGVSVITMPKGRWQLPGPGVGLTLARSNATVNSSGCTLMIQPDPSFFDPMHVQSTPVTSPTYLPEFPDTPPRTVSHLTGTIVPSTTTLTMDPDEICDLDIGETVIIEAGVNFTDPHEPQDYIPATVQSVDLVTGVITFAEPLGVTIVDYVDVDGLDVFVIESQRTKIGDWGDQPPNGSYARGYGTDHGLSRFVGGLVHDVTINAPTFRIDRVPQFETGSYAMAEIVGQAVQRLTINDLQIHNPFQEGVHLSQTFGTVIDGYQTTGHGLGRLSQGPSFQAIAVGMYGGNDIQLRSLDLRSTDTCVYGCEISVRGLVVEDLDYDVDFTSVRAFEPNPIIFGAFSVLEPLPVLRNVQMQATCSGGSAPFYYTGAQVAEGSWAFVGPLIDYFNWGYLQSLALNGTVTIDGVTYGPAITETRDYTIVHGASSRTITPPTGLYTSLTLQVVTPGDLSAVFDTGLDYSAGVASHAVLDVAADRWYLIAPTPTGVADYLGQQFGCQQHNTGSTDDALIRLVMTYLPEVV